MEKYTVEHAKEEDVFWVVNPSNFTVNGPYNYASEAQQRCDELNGGNDND